MNIPKSNKIHGMLIKRNMDELNNSYNLRKWFIYQLKPKNKKAFDEAVLLSNILVNWKYLHCIYPTPYMKKIQKIYVNTNDINFNKKHKIKIKKNKNK